MYTDLLSTIGSGVRIGTLGVVRGTGTTGRAGGDGIRYMHMTGIGIAATHGITTTTTALSVTGVMFAVVIMSYTTV